MITEKRVLEPPIQNVVHVEMGMLFSPFFLLALSAVLLDFMKIQEPEHEMYAFVHD